MERNIKKPDILLVTEYVIKKAEVKQPFSLREASDSAELNGVGLYRLSEIISEICLEPDGPSSMEKYTKIDTDNMYNLQARWQLNSQTYYSYLSYLSLKQSNESIGLSKAALEVATESNKTTKLSFWVAFMSFFVAAVALLFDSFLSSI